jgi:ankyrin repeat protein
VINYFLDNIDIKWKGSHRWTIVHYLCRFGDILVIKLLFEKIFNPMHGPEQYGTWTLGETSKKNQFTPIHYICSKYNNLNSTDQLLAIKLLIDHPVDLECEDVKEWRPIHFICSECNNLNST